MKIQPQNILTPTEEESLDVLTSEWKIFQLKRGHRFSTDDVLTAWMAWRFNPKAERCLDLGAGIGTVGLLTLHKMQEKATLTSVEVQEISYSLARRTVALNGIGDRVRLILGDIRDESLWAPGEKWSQITGSPPYFPVGTAVISPHPQRAGARMELKGDVFDYCFRASRVLAPDGVFSFCHAASDPRPEQAVEKAGLRLICRRNVRFRENQKPTISLFVCAWSGERKDEADFIVRSAEGRWTEEYIAMRREMGVPDLRVPLSEAPQAG